MPSDSGREKSGLEHTAQAANAAKTVLKSGKALAGASRGAALGPYGMAAGLAWEGRKVIAKAAIVFAALLLLPVMILTMLPSMLFGGIGGEDPSETHDAVVWNDAAAEEVLISNADAVAAHYEDACHAVDAVMRRAHAGVLSDIRANFSGYGPNDIMTLYDPYAASLPHDSTRVICEYNALTDFAQTIKISDLSRTLTEASDRFFFYTFAETDGIKTSRVQNEDGTYTEVQTPYKEVTYTVHYSGDDYITDTVFCLTEEQKLLAEDFADSLSLYLNGGDDSGAAD